MLMVIISFFTYVLFFVAPAAVPSRQDPGSQSVSLGDEYRIAGESVPVGYGKFIWAVVRHGELGHSFSTREAVSAQLEQAVPVTASLVIGGSILWLLIAFPIGILSALRPRSLLDRGAMVLVLIGVSAHPVWLGLVLLYVFGVQLHLAPLGGYCNFFNPTAECGGSVEWFDHLILPWFTFALLFAALYTRMIRATIIETLTEDYVRTAEAKGAGSWRVLRSHVLRNALLPVVTMLGMDVGVAFGGALFIETVFGLPGIGRMMVGAISRHDLPIIMGVVLVVSTAVVVANAIVDFVYRWLDPKVRLSTAGSARMHLRSLSLQRKPQIKITQAPTN